MEINLIFGTSIFLFIAFLHAATTGNSIGDTSLPKGISSNVICGIDEMEVEIEELKPKSLLGAHVLGLKEYPDDSCQAERISGGGGLRFRFSFSEYYRCGTTQIRNKLTGTRTFYNRIVLELSNGEEDQLLVKCQRGNQYSPLPVTTTMVGLNNSTTTLTTTLAKKQVKRDVLPAGFKEDPSLIPISEQVGKAPEPMLTMIVKKEGRRIGPKLVVEPGAPLSMEISLDPVSKDIYGILLSQLDVTDTGKQSEILFHNGCSVDTYLFENFVTRNGDVLEAKFKAFKFPDTNYVLFRGTINVCLNSCKGIQCSTGQLGFGRRRRETPDYDYEIHAATVLQVAPAKNISINLGAEHSHPVLESTFQKSPSVVNAKQTQPEWPTSQSDIPRPLLLDPMSPNDSSHVSFHFWVLILGILLKLTIDLGY